MRRLIENTLVLVFISFMVFLFVQVIATDLIDNDIKAYLENESLEPIRAISFILFEYTLGMFTAFSTSTILIMRRKKLVLSLLVSIPVTICLNTYILAASLYRSTSIVINAKMLFDLPGYYVVKILKEPGWYLILLAIYFILINFTINSIIIHHENKIGE